MWLSPVFHNLEQYAMVLGYNAEMLKCLFVCSANIVSYKPLVLAREILVRRQSFALPG